MGRYDERRDSFRLLLEEICELCGLSAKMSPRALLGAAAGYSCTAEEFWNMDFAEHPMKALAYAAGKVLEETDSGAYRPAAVRKAEVGTNETGGQIVMKFAA